MTNAESKLYSFINASCKEFGELVPKEYVLEKMKAELKKKVDDYIEKYLCDCTQIQLRERIAALTVMKWEMQAEGPKTKEKPKAPRKRASESKSRAKK